MKYGKISSNQIVDGVTVAGISTYDPATDQYWNNVSILLHFDLGNGLSFEDSAGKTSAFIQTGTAVSSTTLKKFGASAFYSPGAGSAITVINSDMGLTGSSDFTVEFWFNAPSISGNGGILQLSKAEVINGGANRAFAFAMFGNMTYRGIDGGDRIVGYPIANTWHHVAASRQAGMMRLYFDGIKTQEFPDSGSIETANYVHLGTYYGMSNGSNVYIDEFRFTRGIARYTDSTLPIQTAPFPNAASTSDYGSVQYNRMGRLEGSSLFVYDNENDLLGIGTLTPIERLHVKDGNIKIEGTVGTHGMIFPDATKQTTAATPYSLPTASTAVLGGVKVDDTSISINGSGVLKTIAAGAYSAGGTFDALFNSVQLLINGDGLEGSTDIFDLSSSARTVNRFGQTMIRTSASGVAPIYGTGMIYLDGNGDYLTATIPAIGTQDFCLETYAYLVTGGTQDGNGQLNLFGLSPFSSAGFNVPITSEANIGVSYPSNWVINPKPVTLVNTWVHVAITRSGSVVTLWINGNSVGTGTDGNNKTNTEIQIGASNGAGFFKGYLKDIRLTIGDARRSMSF